MRKICLPKSWQRRNFIMPFKSEAQRKYLWMKHPKIAKRWADKYETPKNLPKHSKRMSLKDAVKRVSK